MNEWNKRARERRMWLKASEATASGMHRHLLQWAMLNQVVTKEVTGSRQVNVMDQAVGGLVDSAMKLMPLPKGLIKAQPPYRDAGGSEKHFLSEEEYNEAVVAPTPEGLWFTPEKGWPREVSTGYGNVLPHDKLVPTGAGNAGLKWRKYTGASRQASKPIKGRELINERLSSELARLSSESSQTMRPTEFTFTAEGRDAFGDFIDANDGSTVTGVRDGDYIKSGTSYFRCESKLFAFEEEDFLGTLSVEVLQAAHLPKMDWPSENDVYALVVFEGCAAATSTLQDAVMPRWHRHAARAMRFPVRAPYSGVMPAAGKPARPRRRGQGEAMRRAVRPCLSRDAQCATSRCSMRMRWPLIRSTRTIQSAASASSCAGCTPTPVTTA
eukprot:1259213-Prymnesium_polylepis.1